MRPLLAAWFKVRMMTRRPKHPPSITLSASAFDSIRPHPKNLRIQTSLINCPRRNIIYELKCGLGCLTGILKTGIVFACEAVLLTCFLRGGIAGSRFNKSNVISLAPRNCFYSAKIPSRLRNGVRQAICMYCKVLTMCHHYHTPLMRDKHSIVSFTWTEKVQ